MICIKTIKSEHWLYFACQCKTMYTHTCTAFDLINVGKGNTLKTVTTFMVWISFSKWNWSKCITSLTPILMGFWLDCMLSFTQDLLSTQDPQNKCDNCKVKTEECGMIIQSFKLKCFLVYTCLMPTWFAFSPLC